MNARPHKFPPSSCGYVVGVAAGVAVGKVHPSGSVGFLLVVGGDG